MAVRKADESDRLFVVEVGMENRAPEEIAKDAAFQISALFNRLIEEQQKNDDQTLYNKLQDVQKVLIFCMP